MKMERDAELFAGAVRVPRLGVRSLAEWRRFSVTALPGLAMGQRWRGGAGEVRGTVRLGWGEERLWVYARLPDADIFNPVRAFNEPAFLQGDVFEMFLQGGLDAERYVEFHVSPENQRFQLAFLRGGDPGGGGAYVQGEYLGELCRAPLDSGVRVDAAGGVWEVWAGVPFAVIGGDVTQLRGSFCRYDATRREDGTLQRELFSTSPHLEARFHRRQEWARLCPGEALPVLDQA